jgi:exopolyphosphatase/pppGpp-phosphohydrolase
MEALRLPQLRISTRGLRFGALLDEAPLWHLM